MENIALAQEILPKRLEREQLARVEAERLLESRSAELYIANKQLHSIADQLSLQTSQLNNILDSAMAGMCLADPDRLIVRTNTYSHRVLGYGPEELFGASIVDIFGKQVVNDARAVVAQSADTAEQVGIEVEGIRRDGSIVPLELFVTEVIFKDRRHTLWNFQDITKRKALAVERDRLEEDLRRANKLEALGTLASGVAHEINTPVQFVGDNLHFLTEAFDDVMNIIETIPQIQPDEDLEFIRSEVPKALEQSIAGLSRVTEIVTAIREFSHPGSKEKTPTDLNKAVSDTVTISVNHWKYVADLTTDLDEDMLPVSCVPGEINQVILNLIVNAAQAIKAKDMADKGTITVSTQMQGDLAEIRVTDTGTGIPEHVQGQIFDPFFTTKEVGEGTGQGLSLAHSIIVKKHGGNIRFETRPGVGTTFIVALRRVESANLPQSDAVCAV